MATKKIREYDSKRLFNHQFKRLSGIELHIRSAHPLSELAASEPWLSSEKLAVKPDMLFGKCGKSGVVGLNLHLDRVASFVKDRIGKEVQTLFVPCEASFTSNYCASLIATLPPEVKGKIEEFINAVFILFLDLNFTFLEMNPFTMVDGNP